MQKSKFLKENLKRNRCFDNYTFSSKNMESYYEEATVNQSDIIKLLEVMIVLIKNWVYSK